MIRDTRRHGQESLVDFRPHVFVEGEEVVLAVRGEDLDCDGLEKVASLVDLFNVVVSEFVDLALEAEARYLARNDGNDGLIPGREKKK